MIGYYYNFVITMPRNLMMRLWNSVPCTYQWHEGKLRKKSDDWSNREEDIFFHDRHVECAAHGNGIQYGHNNHDSVGIQ